MSARPCHWKLLARAGLGSALALLLAPAGLAESTSGTGSATAHISLRVIVPPVLRVLQVRRVAGGIEYRIWTNMRTAHFNGRVHRFEKVGENILLIPVESDGVSVVPSV